ncbi:MAG: hypothetical protein WAO08_05880 [Hyphomicrobiaceae bacterium]
MQRNSVGWRMRQVGPPRLPGWPTLPDCWWEPGWDMGGAAMPAMGATGAERLRDIGLARAASGVAGPGHGFCHRP